MMLSEVIEQLKQDHEERYRESQRKYQEWQDAVEIQNGVSGKLCQILDWKYRHD